MFQYAPFNQPIEGWDVSNVTNMGLMFARGSFNQPIGQWDVSSATNMAGMFEGASFNQTIGGWSVYNVVNMAGMFFESSFNQPIEQWDVRNVTHMGSMFGWAQSFNRDLSSWCVANIASRPNGFDDGATSWTLPRPNWGMTCGLGVGFGDEQFSLIPAGTFQMGSTNGGSSEQPVHTVTLTQSFEMQRTEVTQGQWFEIMGTNPSHFSSCGVTCPVEGVSWDDIQQFLTALNARFPGRNYRLPTEAEWEYAARAGTTGDYGGTGILDDMGWYSGNSENRTHPVARKQPNAWDLYDMHGNMWEWVQDWYAFDYYGVSPGVDPTGPTTGSFRVLRGGSWVSSAGFARSAVRVDVTPSSRFSSVGFRLARTP